MDSQFSAEQVARGRELVRADRETRLELGDLLLDVAPVATRDSDGRSGGDDGLGAFASAIGLSVAQARRYRKVAAGLREAGRESLAETGVAVGYAAISAALLRSGGSAELLLDLCRTAAAEGRDLVTATEVESARRAVIKAAATERRLKRASEQAERNRLERQERRVALAPYRDGIEVLVAARVAEGAEREAAEAAVVSEIAERMIGDGGNPAELLELDSEIITRHADLIKAARRRAGELRSITRSLQTAQNSLERLAGDHTIDTGSDQVVQEWRATLDRIITDSVDLAERLRRPGDAAQ